MSETSNHRTVPASAACRRGGRLVHAWLEAEAAHDVQAAEAALGRVLRQGPPAMPRAGFASRVMTAARERGAVPAQAPERRHFLVACVLGAWASSAATVLVGLLVSVPILADGARVVRYGWALIDGLRRSALAAAGSPDGVLLLAAALIVCATALTWLGRLLAADASDASIAGLETA